VPRLHEGVEEGVEEREVLRDAVGAVEREEEPDGEVGAALRHRKPLEQDRERARGEGEPVAGKSARTELVSWRGWRRRAARSSARSAVHGESSRVPGGRRSRAWKKSRARGAWCHRSLRTALATGAGIGSEGAGAAARRDAESDRADAAVSVEDGWFRTSAAIWRGHRGGLDGGAGVVDAAAVGEGGGGGGIGQFRGEEFFPPFSSGDGNGVDFTCEYGPAATFRPIWILDRQRPSSCPCFLLRTVAK